jgi:hypothetical protein
MEKVFAFQYCDCIHESSFFTESLHKTQKGAEMAMEFHKNERFKEFEKYKEETEYSDIEFGQFEDWRVIELDIQD